MLADAVQGCMVGQILDHREIEVERTLLKDDAGHAQSLARGMSDIVAENPDMTALNGVEARDQREQCTLSSSVEAEQNGESRRRNGEGHVIERLPPAIGMADAFDGDGGRVDGHHFVHHAHVRFFRPLANAIAPVPSAPECIRRGALPPPCGLKTRGSPSPRRLPGGKRESSGFSDRREAKAEAVTAGR